MIRATKHAAYQVISTPKEALSVVIYRRYSPERHREYPPVALCLTRLSAGHRVPLSTERTMSMRASGLIGFWKNAMFASLTSLSNVWSSSV